MANAASDSGSDSGESAMADLADFVDAFAVDSDDGELPAVSVELSAQHSSQMSHEAASASHPLDTTHEASRVAGATAELAATATAARAPGWAALRVSFCRSDPPVLVATAFRSVPGWQLTQVQEALWHDILSARVARGAGSREYVKQVLKAVVDACDRARVEIAEILLDKLLALRADAVVDSDVAEANAALAAVEFDATDADRAEAQTKEPCDEEFIRSEDVLPNDELRPHVIALGTDCFCRTQAVRLGWMASRAQGYQSGPFDIAYHSYAAVCSLIKEDFAGYMDPGTLRIDTVDQQWTSARAPVHRRLPGVAFNHEGEPVCDAATTKAWAKDDFADLRERYNRRVENFRRKIAEAIEISKSGEIGAVFLLHHHEHPTELSAAIEARWPSLEFVILTLNLVAGRADVVVSAGAAGVVSKESVHTFLTADGEWTDKQYRWARGLAPSSEDECSRLLLDALPPEVRWDSCEERRGDKHARQRWCFYNVRVPHPEQSWIETIRLAGEELDEAVRASVGNALDSMIAARP